MAKSKSKAPSGLTIERSNGTFLCNWTKGETYESQEFVYFLNWGGWIPIAVGKTATGQNLDFSIWNLHPYGSPIQVVSFCVRGKAKDKKWSDWNQAILSLYAPIAPSVSMTPKSREVATFSWSANDDTTSINPYTVVEYQHQLTEGSATPNWNVASVMDATAEKSIDVTEDSTTISAGSHTRWFRVRTRGMAGDSGWVVQKRLYATPHQAVITSTSTTQDGAGLNVFVSYQTQSSAEYAIDNIDAEYVIVTPAADVSLPSGELSWTNVGGLITAKGTDSISFPIGGTLEDDKALFVRVNTRHEDAAYNRIAYGTPALVAAGYLSDPTNIAITNIDTSLHRVTVQATNNSSVPDSVLVVRYKSNDEEFDIAVIPHGQNSVTIQCPAWGEGEISFGVRAVVGTCTYSTRTDNVNVYKVDEKMSSKASVWEGGNFPIAPENVTVTSTSVEGSAKVEWDWSWSEAHSAQIAWADHMDAWESTDEPSTYTVSNVHASSWNIAGLELGKTWYVRVRLIGGTNDAVTYSPWSSPIAKIDLSSAPAVPMLTLSHDVITLDDMLTAYWSYISSDGKAQSYAEICEATESSGIITYGRVIGHTQTAQHIDIDPKEVGWSAGDSKKLCVRVVSSAGKNSEGWSPPAMVKVANPISATISSTSLVHTTIDDREADYLRAMPLTVTVTGAGYGGVTSLVIERANDYRQSRPDETEFHGYKDEIVATATQTGEAAIVISSGDFDDGGTYKMTATVKDSVGQVAKAEMLFLVNWSHKAVVPDATIEMLDGGVAKITPELPNEVPTGWEIAEGDTCDIYRLSADKPELIYKGAEFDTAYVDPYPAIGEFGGHRLVYRTKDGDYITEDKTLAWLDTDEDNGDIYDTDTAIIDFGGEQVHIKYNLDLSNKWEKDFQETKYLGGSIQGDWNEGVRRTSSLSTVTITTYDQDTIRQLRRLAEYNGICHVRTLDGSSYSCDIQVSESRASDKLNVISSFSFDITRIDSQEYDGVTYEQWSESQSDAVE